MAIGYALVGFDELRPPQVRLSHDPDLTQKVQGKDIILGADGHQLAAVDYHHRITLFDILLPC